MINEAQKSAIDGIIDKSIERLEQKINFSPYGILFIRTALKGRAFYKALEDHNKDHTANQTLIYALRIAYGIIEDVVWDEAIKTKKINNLLNDAGIASASILNNPHDPQESL